jgi:hypothetical protein
MSIATIREDGDFSGSAIRLAGSTGPGSKAEGG